MTLHFDYAARQWTCLKSSTFHVKWNGKIVRTIVPENYKVNHVKISLTAIVGKNSLTFVGADSHSQTGASLDNVKLIRKSGCHPGNEDLVHDGDFESHHGNI